MLLGAVFVPLSGLTSVNFANTVGIVDSDYCFRPLIGVNFCKPENTIDCFFDDFDKFSSPYRG